MRIKHGVSIAVITPVVLAGAVAAGPAGSAIQSATSGPEANPAVAAEPSTDGVSVVAMAKPPAALRVAGGAVPATLPAAMVTAPGGMRIPAMALSAYRKAEQTMAVAAPNCGISWNLLAGIGRIESSHANGGATDARGTAIRPIYGPVLDGSLPGNEVIVQSNSGGRAVYARAMGPMQFLPGTWSRYASDGDGDGRSDPQNIFDASLAAARYLCSGGLNLRNQAQTLTAILRYNNSMPYAVNVMGWANAYATGVMPVDLPAISGPVPALGDAHLEAKPEGLGPELQNVHGLPTGEDPLAALVTMGTLGNTEAAAQLAPGPAAGVGGLGAEHGCEVICMASQLPESTAATAARLPPWMMPAPWMAPAAPPPWMPQPGAPAPGPVPLGMPPGPAAEVPAGPVPAAAAPAAPVPAAPPAPGTPPWMAPPPPVPAPPAPAEAAPVVPADNPVLMQGPGPLPGPAN